ncbi:MAG: MATE family efflux transporter [Verrucomicrobia bacterium]|jgi:MATE family multidrug resistance protein|nr:MATE family efflux transporter [Verrucomicrobiota bacterium]
MASPSQTSWWQEARATLTLGFPIMTGLVGQMLMGVADTVMVGRVGTVPLAAASLGFHLSHVLMVAGFGVISGITVFTAKACGTGQRGEAGEVLRHGVLMGLVTGVLAALILAMVRDHLTRLGQPEEVVREGSTFLLLIGLSLVPVMLAQTVKQFAEALAHPWPPMLIYTGGVGLNILLNWVFIYGHWGAPAMGLTGAGVATLIARSAVFVAMVGLLRVHPALRAWAPQRWILPAARVQVGRLIRLGAPVGLLNFLEVGAFGFAGLMTGWIGPQAMAANQIALTCAATTFMFALGFAMAVGIRVGHAWGREDREAMRRVGLNGMGCTAVVMGGFALMFLALRQPITGFFSPDLPVVTLAASLLLVVAFFQLFDGQQVVAIFALRGMEDVRVPATVAVLAYWGLAIPLGYALAFPLRLGALGIWIGLALGLAVLAITLGRRFHRLTRPESACARSAV